MNRDRGNRPLPSEVVDDIARRCFVPTAHGEAERAGFKLPGGLATLWSGLRCAVLGHSWSHGREWCVCIRDACRGRDTSRIPHGVHHSAPHPRRFPPAAADVDTNVNTDPCE